VTCIPREIFSSSFQNVSQNLAGNLHVLASSLLFPRDCLYLTLSTWYRDSRARCQKQNQSLRTRGHNIDLSYIRYRSVIHSKYLACKRGFVGQSEGLFYLFIPRSSVRIRLKPKNSNSHGFKLHRPLINSIKLLFKVINLKSNHHHYHATRSVHLTRDLSMGRYRFWRD